MLRRVFWKHNIVDRWWLLLSSGTSGNVCGNVALLMDYSGSTQHCEVLTEINGGTLTGLTNIHQHVEKNVSIVLPLTTSNCVSQYLYNSGVSMKCLSWLFSSTEWHMPFVCCKPDRIEWTCVNSNESQQFRLCLLSMASICWVSKQGRFAILVFCDSESDPR